ncbi:Stk1 family PASTA domain-containing Ser/Thr kinase [Salibacterium salarium]|uniref:Serine/threonine-protein kinase PrkC n=1 Tax=Salibacterium salarium TaxID=284579 RepID=A0A3R9P509_9BACI|nr:Stk1 family PASTA domain-containing Ser/Thr kinase [Salibacterium salarium]RSL31274.1 Stk1 family PASTA domain-containing Ser/Thr kinase [Salibacterium salarium]
MSDLVGKRISERYDIREMIGGGGMAHVYRGEDAILERPVAVKVLQPQYNKDEEFIRRFHREAQAATSLAHPNIVNIYDVGEEEHLYYIVMEHVDGFTLKEKIQQQGPLPLEQAVELMGQVLGAISHAHTNHIVHRDMKPHNILLNHDGDAKVTDFGIARASTAATITHTNSVMGSVHYMSPEQAKGGVITTKSDIYSLGVVLYEMVTGSLPYTGDSAVSIALKHLQEPLPVPSEKRPGLPQSMENIIVKATAKNADDRYESVVQMHQDLQTALSKERRNEPPFVLPVDEDATKAVPIIKEENGNGSATQTVRSDTLRNGSEKGEESTEIQPPPKKKKRRWLWIIIMLVLLFFGAAIAAFTVIPDFLMADDVEVPDVENKTEERAIQELEDAEFAVESEQVNDDAVEAGSVVRQNPSGGSVVKEESTVQLYVSEGPDTQEMPDLNGVSREQAEEMLADYGSVEYSASQTSDYPSNQIIGQDPEVGADVVPEETTVYLTYSTKPEFSLQNLKGESRQAAENYLESSNLEGTFETSFSDTVAQGNVIEHSPGPYSTVKEGDDITFTISDGPEEPEESNEPEEEQSEEMEAVIPVEVSESDQEEGIAYNIRIVYEDATTSGPTIFTEESISETKTYRVPLEVTPESDGTYTLYVDNDEVQSNSFSYGD